MSVSAPCSFMWCLPGLLKDTDEYASDNQTITFKVSIKQPPWTEMSILQVLVQFLGFTGYFLYPALRLIPQLQPHNSLMSNCASILCYVALLLQKHKSNANGLMSTVTASKDCVKKQVNVKI